MSRFPALSRNELALTLCEHLNWLSPKGDYRRDACLRTLETLEAEGIITLPAPRNMHPKAKSPHQASQSEAARSTPETASLPDPILCNLAHLEPLTLVVAESPEDKAEWQSLMEQYHPLGCPRPFGSSLRWFLVDSQGQRLACFLFEAACRMLKDRDQWIGWKANQREKNLVRVLGNTRFLVLPWVKVKNLASRALGMAIATLSDEWQRRYNYRPVLVETFVDPTHYEGTCYRAANWIHIGQTAGLGPEGRRKSKKDILMMPLDKRFREILTGRMSVKTTKALGQARRKAHREAGIETQKAGLRAMWTHLIKAATALAERYDERWQR